MAADTVLSPLSPSPQPYSKRLMSPSHVSIDGEHLVNHASRLGITLRSSGLLPSRRLTHTAPGGSARRQRAGLGVYSRNRTEAMQDSGLMGAGAAAFFSSSPTYISNVIKPLSVGDVGRSSTAPAGASRSKSGLPGVRRGQTARSSAHSIRSLSTYIDRYMTCGSSDGGGEEEEEDSKSWNKSQQAKRFNTEQRNLNKSRQMRRTSEVQSHRMDRSYYMCGTPVKMEYKYSVDQTELERLKELSRTRNKGGSRYYGRGLSDYPGAGNTEYNEDEVPRQPPPSSLGHAEPFPDNDSQAEYPRDSPGLTPGVTQGEPTGEPQGADPSQDPPAPGTNSPRAPGQDNPREDRGIGTFLTQGGGEEEEEEMTRPVTGRTDDSISLPDEDKQQQNEEEDKQQTNEDEDDKQQHEEHNAGDTTHNRTELTEPDGEEVSEQKEEEEVSEQQQQSNVDEGKDGDKADVWNNGNNGNNGNNEGDAAHQEI